MCRTGSGSPSNESVEGQPGGFLAGRNHALDCDRAGHITGERDSRMNEEIGVVNSRVIMRGVSAARAGMMRMNADAAQ